MVNVQCAASCARHHTSSTKYFNIEKTPYLCPCVCFIEYGDLEESCVFIRFEGIPSVAELKPCFKFTSILLNVQNLFVFVVLYGLGVLAQ